MENWESRYSDYERRSTNDLEQERAAGANELFQRGNAIVQEIITNTPPTLIQTHSGALQYYKETTRGVDLLKKITRLKQLTQNPLKTQEEISLDNFTIPIITIPNSRYLLTEDEQVSAKLSGLDASREDLLNLLELPDEPIIRYRRDLMVRIFNYADQRHKTLVSQFWTTIPEVYVRYSYKPNDDWPVRSVVVPPISHR